MTDNDGAAATETKTASSAKKTAKDADGADTTSTHSTSDEGNKRYAQNNDSSTFPGSEEDSLERDCIRGEEIRAVLAVVVSSIISPLSSRQFRVQTVSMRDALPMVRTSLLSLTVR